MGTRPPPTPAVCIRSVLFPLLDSEGRVRNVVVMIEDMTARKRAEDALVASEDRYLVLTNHIADGVSIYQDGSAVFVNPAFASMLGYTVDALIGKDPVDLMHEDYRDAFRRTVQSYDKGVSKEPFECVCIHPRRKAGLDGGLSRRPFSGRVSPQFCAP